MISRALLTFRSAALLLMSLGIDPAHLLAEILREASAPTSPKGA